MKSKEELLDLISLVKSYGVKIIGINKQNAFDFQDFDKNQDVIIRVFNYDIDNRDYIMISFNNFKWHLFNGMAVCDTSNIEKYLKLKAFE